MHIHGAQPETMTCWVGPGAVAQTPGGWGDGVRGAPVSSPLQLGTPLHGGFLPPGGLPDLWAARRGSPGASQQLPLPRRLGWSAVPSCWARAARESLSPICL